MLCSIYVCIQYFGSHAKYAYYKYYVYSILRLILSSCENLQIYQGIDTAFDYRDQMDINDIIHNTFVFV